MTERERAIAHVAALIVAYRAMHVRGSRFAKGRIEALSTEIGFMQARGEPGDTLARRWCLVTGA